MRARIRPELQHLAVPVSDLRPFEDNPNNGDTDRIARSLRELGQYRPVTYWQHGAPPWQVLTGNHTYAAAVGEGMTEVAATPIVADTWEEATAVVLADNHLARRAVMDTAAEVALLEALQASNWMPASSYDLADLDALRAALEHDAASPIDAGDGDHGAERRGGAGLREALLLLSEDDYAELMRLLAAIREVVGEQPQGLVVLAAARTAVAVLDGGAGHPRGCSCSWCTVARQAGVR